MADSLLQPPEKVAIALRTVIKAEDSQKIPRLFQLHIDAFPLPEPRPQKAHIPALRTQKDQLQGILIGQDMEAGKLPDSLAQVLHEPQLLRYLPGHHLPQAILHRSQDREGRAGGLEEGGLLAQILLQVGEEDSRLVHGPQGLMEGMDGEVHEGIPALPDVVVVRAMGPVQDGKTPFQVRQEGGIVLNEALIGRAGEDHIIRFLQKRLIGRCSGRPGNSQAVPGDRDVQGFLIHEHQPLVKGKMSAPGEKGTGPSPPFHHGGKEESGASVGTQIAPTAAVDPGNGPLQLPEAPRRLQEAICPGKLCCIPGMT